MFALVLFSRLEGCCFKCVDYLFLVGWVGCEKGAVFFATQWSAVLHALLTGGGQLLVLG